MSTLKICHIIPDGDIPTIRPFAPSIVIQSIIKYMNDCEHYFVVKKENENVYEKRQNIEIFRVEENKFLKKLDKKLNTTFDPLYRKSVNIIRKYKCDVVLAHQREFNVNKLRKMLGYDIPIISYNHGIGKFKKNIGIPNKYIAVSEYSKSLMIQEGYPANKIEVIYNGIDKNFIFKQFDEIKFKERLNINTNDIVVSFIGRKVKEKGYYKFLQLAQILLKKYDNISFLSVGPIMYNEDYILELEQKLLKHPKFYNFNSIQHNEIYKFFRISDIFIMLTEYEQHSIAAVEAMGYKNIVIASNLSSFPEMIESSKNGFLIDDIENLDNILQLLDKIIINFDDYKKLGYNAQRTVLNKFLWEHSANRLLKIINEILKEKNV